MNALWLRKVWVLANGVVSTQDINIPNSLAKRFQLVDRCTFMPKGTCPTRNAGAVMAFVHLLPGLAERFVYAEDDIFLGRPISPLHLYTAQGKPFVWRTAPTWGKYRGKQFHELYDDPAVVKFPTPKSSSPSPHYWYPHLKSVCASMEQRYPEFYAFVGSHSEGRYSSVMRGYNDTVNSQEEDFNG